jgi:hypothetical protein
MVSERRPRVRSVSRTLGIVLGMCIALGTWGAGTTPPVAGSYCENNTCDPSTPWLCEYSGGSQQNCAVNPPGSEDPCTQSACMAW